MSDLIGMVLDRVAFPVERGKVREFARATFAEDPAHTDLEVAAERGFGDVLATGTHVVVASHHRDQGAFVARLGLDISRIVVGSVEWEYERAVCAGDELVGNRVVVADETRDGKRGGTMRLVTLQTDCMDASGSLVVRQREVLIERGRS